MNFTKDDQGWSIVPISNNAKNIYIDPDLGNDNNDGSSDSKAVKTVAKAWKLADRTKQNVFNVKAGKQIGGFTFLFGGPSPDAPNILTSYGNGRAKLSATSDNGIYATGVSNLVVINFELSPATQNTGRDKGISFINTSNVLVEGCLIKEFRNNVTNESSDNKYASNFTIRRNTIIDSFDNTPSGQQDRHSQGLYVYRCDGILIEENTFSGNGWGSGKASKTIFNHNVYLNGDNKNVVARGNIFANASSHGLQQRPGGVCEYNLFYTNAIGFSYGLTEADGPHYVGGVTGYVKGNVVLRGSDIGNQKRGIGVQLANIKPDSNVSFTENIVGYNTQTQGDYYAIRLEFGEGRFSTNAVGVNDLLVKDNITWRWDKAFEVEARIKPNSHGTRNISNVVLDSNYFPDILGKEKLTVTNPVTSPSYPNPDVVIKDFSDLIERSKNSSVRGPSWNIENCAIGAINQVRVGFGLKPIDKNYKVVTEPPHSQLPDVKISKVSVINTSTQTAIGELANGTVFNFAAYPINFLVELTDDRGSIKVNINGQERTESTPPFAVFGDSGSGFNPWNPAVGNYTLTINAYNEKQAAGKLTEIKIFNFKVVKPDVLITNVTVNYADNTVFTSDGSIDKVVIYKRDGTTQEITKK